MSWRSKMNRSRQPKYGRIPLRRRESGRALRFETMETRHLLAGFLQGFAFVDLNNNTVYDAGDTPKVGAAIELQSGDGSTVLDTQFTNSNGYYRFDGLSTDTYRLVEATVPAGYMSNGVQIDDILSDGSIVNANTIQVNFTAVDDPIWVAPDPLTVHRQPGLTGVASAFTVAGGPFNAFSAVSNVTNAHQFQLILSGGALNPDPSAAFYSFCVDLFHVNPSVYGVQPSLTPQTPGLATNIGKIGYLYNTYGRQLLSPTDGTALQLALYELIYDTTPDLTSGNYIVNAGGTNPAAYAAANAFLAAAVDKDERAVFLNLTQDAQIGEQGMLVTENFNFANKIVAGDLNITITPDQTNEVGVPHTFTVTVQQDLGDGVDSDMDGSPFDSVANAPVTVDLTSLNGASAVPSTPLSGMTDANGHFQVTFTSLSAGLVVGNATTTFTVNGTSLTRDTDPATSETAGPGGSGPATKRYVDAKIIITPDSTNEVGQPHTFTATVYADNGDGVDDDGVMGNYDAVGAGEDVAITLTSSNGAAAVPSTPLAGVTDVLGQFSVTFTSLSAGLVVGSATSNVDVAGLVLPRTTDGSETVVGSGVYNSGTATKRYVDAKIIITPDSTNEVGQPHTFTATVYADNGDGVDDDGVMGNYDAVGAGEDVAITLTSSNGAAAVPSTPLAGVTDVLGQFSVTFTSLSAGLVVGSATSNVDVAGLVLPRTTDGSETVVGSGVYNSGTATKRYVDAKIIITPDSTNEVGQPHTFTATVYADNGDGVDDDGVMGNYDAVGAGEDVAITLTSSNGAAAVPSTPLAGVTDVLGQFSVTFTSLSAGLVVGSATSNVDVAGLVLPRTTDGSETVVGSGVYNSGTATKRYVDARITIGPDATNNVGDPHTFTVTVQQDDGLTAAQGGDGVTGFADVVNAPVTVTLANVGTAVATPAGPFAGNTNASGQFQVTFTSATPGQVIGNATTTFIVGGVSLTRDTDPATANIGSGPGGSGPAVKTYVKPGIKMKKYTNGLDADTMDSGPEIAPGGVVMWTYIVENTGQTDFAQSDIVITDDAGTPGNPLDDFSTAGGNGTNSAITFDTVLVGDGDNILEPGEIWRYKATGVAQDLSVGSGVATTFDFSGNSALDGPDANIRTYTSGSLSVNASAFSRDTSGNWSTAWLGSYSGGLGVTDPSEGNGSNNAHTVDNTGGDNYVLLEFSDTVVLDSAYLGYVVDDSDLRLWIGTVNGAFNSHQTLSDAFLTSLGFTEVNETTLTTPRLADLNAGNIAGNVIVIAANTGEPTTEDNFKIQNLTTKLIEHLCYENYAVVTTGPGGPTSTDLSHYCNPAGQPGIELKKYTNDADADTMTGAPQIAAGGTVTWTYIVKNTGTTNFNASQIVITDDAGTPGVLSDDFSTAGGNGTNSAITFESVLVGDGDNVLEPGEQWLYKATGIAQNLTGGGGAASFDFSGSSSLSGSAGNVRTFTSGSISVKASGFSRDKTSGAWAAAWLGSYSGGLGVTDGSEGTGSNNTHTVDNNGTRDNYVLLEFDQSVVLDTAFLGYVVGDSDLTLWIGTVANAFNSHVTLSDSVLAGLGFSEISNGGGSTRTADVNAGNVAGNVIVIAAKTGDSDDYFKIQNALVRANGCYENYAVVTTGPGGPTSTDLSHYCNPEGVPGIKIKKYTNGADADTPDTAALLNAGDTVTWTYIVTNTGTLPFAAGQVVITDDAGTPGVLSDDFSTAGGNGTNSAITFQSVLVGDADNMLEPGEQWLYKATGIAQELVTTGAASQFNFGGSSSTTGTSGNTRTFSAGGISVKTSAFSRDKSTGAWSSAYLGSYSGGLGVTDGSESGSNNTHTVDNNGSRDNYALFEFNQTVIVDSAFLGYVVGDSDLTVWIGSAIDPFNNHLALSDSLLTGLGFTEVNLGGGSTRTADFNAGNMAGNVLVIAAKKGDSDDYFKIDKLNVAKVELGVYGNIGKVMAGGVSDIDKSHYKNMDCIDVTYNFAGNTSTTGTAGNIRTYSVNGVSVNASAFSRTTSGTWNAAYLGAYSEGLGVTDTSENGSNGTHRVDNLGRVNFVLFEFSTLVEIDRVFLDSVVGDSDISIWVGTADNPFHNHLTLSDASGSLATLAETNDGGSSARWADVNADHVYGNIVVIAASITDPTPDDQFKISQLEVCAKPVKFYTVDSGSDDTFEYGPDGGALANYNLAASNSNPRGVTTTAAGTKVWVVDGSKVVYVYDTDGKVLGSWTANGLTTPEDITTNGTDIWIVDDGSNKVFRYSNAASRTSGSQSAAASFALNSGNQNAKGIVTDGTYLWVVNDTSTVDKVFKYKASDGSLVGSWTIDAANGSPTGITLSPTDVDHLWITDIADNAVYRYASAAGRISGSQNSAEVFQLAGGNNNVQGIADPPPAGADSAGRFGLASELHTFALPVDTQLATTNAAFSSLASVSPMSRSTLVDRATRLQPSKVDRWFDVLPTIVPAMSAVPQVHPQVRDMLVNELQSSGNCDSAFAATDAAFGDFDTHSLDSSNEDLASERVLVCG